MTATDTEASNCARRLLLFHAHPDDESISTGVTMARYAAEGVHVTLVTCTLGEEGKIRLPRLAGLSAEHADQLGGYRLAELGQAVTHLGVFDWRLLGGVGEFRDSGMTGSPANARPRAFWGASESSTRFAAAVAAAAGVIREVRPQVVITYDPRGGYGHPDHIMTHRVAIAAVDAAAQGEHGGDGRWRVGKVYWTAMPRSVLRTSLEALKRSGSSFPVAERVEDLRGGVDDTEVTSLVVAPAFYEAKRAALAAHATQLVLDGRFYALAGENRGREVLTTEYFQLARGELGPARDSAGLEVDLFSGITTVEVEWRHAS